MYDTKEFGNTIESHGLEIEEGLGRKEMITLMILKKIFVSKPRCVIQESDEQTLGKNLSGPLEN